MKKWSLKAVIILLVLILPGCTTKPPADTSEQLRYECSHGVADHNLYETGLHYTGSKIEFDYAFHNVNMDSNFGIMLFLNGLLQPFSLDGSSESCIQIIDLKKDTQDKLVHISFDPITGESGQTAQLTIIAIFDAGTDYDCPTLAPYFFHNLSQSAPISIMMDKAATNMALPEGNSEYNCNFVLKSSESQNQDIIDGLIPSEESIETNKAFNFSLLNAYEETVEYCVYAFINNQPIQINNASNFTLSCEPVSQVLIEGTLMNYTQNEDSDLFYIIAVPNHVYNIESFPPVLKMSTLKVVQPTG